MNKSIWERRLEIEGQEHAERQAALDPISAKFRPLYEALTVECGVSGHEWRFSTFSVGGQAFFVCNYCQKTRVEDGGKRPEKQRAITVKAADVSSEVLLAAPRKSCSNCGYSDGMENAPDGSWFCHRCGDGCEP